MTNPVVDLKGWKGKSGLEITHGNDFYVIREHRKSKESGESAVQETRVPRSIVEALRQILRENCPVGKKFKYREIVGLIKNFYGIQVSTDAWNGGYNRGEYYFPLQYYPTKILEYEGFISYDGRGNVVRLK